MYATDFYDKAELKHSPGQRPASYREGELPHESPDWTGCKGQEVRAIETEKKNKTQVHKMLLQFHLKAHD